MKALILNNIQNQTYIGQYTYISLTNCNNITLNEVIIINYKKIAIELTNCTNITISKSSVSNCGVGIYALNSSNVNIDSCNILNSTTNKSHQIQFDTCTNGSITNNILDNDSTSKVSDLINLFQCTANEQSPILVQNNKLRGGTCKTGAGIQLGDSYDGGLTNSYQICKNNILVNTNTVGISTGSGTFITVDNNIIFSDTRLVPYAVGIDCENYYNIETNNIVITNNKVNWLNKKGEQNEWCDDGNCGVIDWSTNIVDNTLSEIILPINLIN